MATEPESKPLVWMGSSRRDFRDFPQEVKADMGYALFVAQRGGKHTSAKVLKGFGGSDVVEIKADDRSGTFRAVYTVRFADVVYVLHAFQKKSTKGAETPKPDLELIEKRLRDVEHLRKEAGV
jgi:phage-related protein